MTPRPSFLVDLPSKAATCVLEEAKANRMLSYKDLFLLHDHNALAKVNQSRPLVQNQFSIYVEITYIIFIRSPISTEEVVQDSGCLTAPPPTKYYIYIYKYYILKIIIMILNCNVALPAFL